jgi:hypothetical protein
VNRFAALALIALAASCTDRGATKPIVDEPPETLRETGLFADWDNKQIAASNRPFTPQYPLWSDGAKKRRWIYLPPGSAIDASQPDAWQFPIGTRLWKEFSFGSRTETRYMVHTAAGWRFATYVWSADEQSAVRAPREGTLSVELTKGERHHIPGEGECRACHANGKTPVLGFSALQLSVDRDPNAVHREAVAPGSLDLSSAPLRNAPAVAPRIAGSPIERAALGYLHGNCGHCHRSDGAVASLGMVLTHSSAEPFAALRTTIAMESKFRPPFARVAPGSSEQSVLIARMRSRSTLEQMPPLGTQLVDEEAVGLIARWIDQLAPTKQGEVP